RWRSVRKKMGRFGVSISAEEPEVGYRLLEQFARSAAGRERHRFAGGAEVFVPFAFGRRGSRRAAKQLLWLLRTTTAREDFTSAAGLTEDQLRRIHHPVLAIYGENSRCL